MDGKIQEMSDISVIVCCYNPDYQKLIKTLISIENQRGVDFDIVVADDGSSQDFFDKVKLWAIENHFDNIQYHKNITNQGTIANIKNAIPFCQSNYVKTISPGVFLFDEHSLFHYLNGFKEHEATIVTGKSVYFDKNYNIIPTLYPKLKQSLKTKYMARNFVCYGDSILGASLAFEKSFLLKGLEEYQGIVKCLEDKPLVNKCILENKKISFSDNILVWYEFESGISTSGNKKGILFYDMEQFYLHLSFSKNKYEKVAAKIFFRGQRYNKIKKIFLYPFLEPKYLCFLLKIRFKKYPCYEKDVSKLYKITELRYEK